MNGIEELKQMLTSRSTDYGKMSQILNWYLLNIDNEISKLRRPKRNCDRFSSSEELKEYLRTHSVNRNGKIFIDGKQYTTAYVWLFEPLKEEFHA